MRKGMCALSSLMYPLNTESLPPMHSHALDIPFFFPFFFQLRHHAGDFLRTMRETTPARLLETPEPDEGESGVEQRSKSSEDVMREISPGLSDRALPVASAPPIPEEWAPPFPYDDADTLAYVPPLSQLANALTDTRVRLSSEQDDESRTVVASDDGDMVSEADGIDMTRLSVHDDRTLSSSLGRLHALCEEDEEQPDYPDADTKSL